VTVMAGFTLGVAAAVFPADSGSEDSGMDSATADALPGVLACAIGAVVASVLCRRVVAGVNGNSAKAHSRGLLVFRWKNHVFFKRKIAQQCEMITAACQKSLVHSTYT
jgi:hypothetical protein